MTRRRKDSLAHLNLVLASEFSSLEVIIDSIEAFLQKHLERVDDDFRYRLLMLASEATTNAIEHGNRLDPEKKVTFDMCLFHDCVECCVGDEGDGFQRDAVDNPLLDENLLHDGGRGLFLLETMADEISYDDGGCRVHMRCNMRNEKPE